MSGLLRLGRLYILFLYSLDSTQLHKKSLHAKYHPLGIILAVFFFLYL